MFISRLRVERSVFLLGTEMNDDSNFYPMFQKGIFRQSKGRGHENFTGDTTPDPHLFLLRLPHSPLLRYAMVGLPAFILRGVTDLHKSKNSSAAVPFS